ncbi:hypothetical protein GCM10027435_02930 [Haloparvum alkalitolerans]|uniref:hypothetical protein n=1 Tax=Haloparvum alkalitolerans TaxID=1042953 RepID=UPI003CEB8629
MTELGSRGWLRTGRRDHDPISLGGLLLAAGALGVGSDGGVVAAVGLLLTGLLLTSLPAVAAGQLWLLLGGEPRLLTLVMVQVGLLIVLTEPARTVGVRSPIVLTAALFAMFAVSIGVLQTQLSIGWLAAGLCLVVAMGVYGCHRYLRVRLGLARPTMET